MWRFFQHVVRADAAYEHRGGHVAGDAGVHEFRLGVGIEYQVREARKLHAHRQRIELRALRILHEAVGDQDPHGRQVGSQRNQVGDDQVLRLGQALPAEHHETDERRLHEESHQAFDRERRAEGVADEARVVRPVGPELELHRQAGGDTQREVDQEQPAPEMGHPAVDVASGGDVDRLHRREHEGKAERQRNEQEMIERRHGELPSRQLDHRIVDHRSTSGFWYAGPAGPAQCRIAACARGNCRKIRIPRSTAPRPAPSPMTDTTAPSAKRETLGFQAEVRQLLDLMIHSLYSNREIFLRELVSNASDACDKLRFEALHNPALFEDGAELAIRVDYDPAATTLTIADNGIGMNRDEVIANLGTIRQVGHPRILRAAVRRPAEGRPPDRPVRRRGRSSSIVADRVTVVTRRAAEIRPGRALESEGAGRVRRRGDRQGRARDRDHAAPARRPGRPPVRVEAARDHPPLLGTTSSSRSG